MPYLIVFQEVRERRSINDPGIKKRGEGRHRSDTPTLSVEAKHHPQKKLMDTPHRSLLQSKSDSSNKAEQNESEII
jgi:hypothetical protein